MDVKEIKRLIEESRHPSISGLIGENPSKYSKSRIMWNSAFAFNGISSEYLTFDVSREELPDVLDLLTTHPRVIGFNTTNPHKKSVAQHPKIKVDDAAKVVGNVNTVHRMDEVVHGHSTDGYGALKSLEEIAGAGTLSGKNILVLGAGDTGSAISVECSSKGGLVTVANRTFEKAISLAERAISRGMTITATALYYPEGVYSQSFLDSFYAADVVINTLTVEKETGNPIFNNGMPSRKIKVNGKTFLGRKKLCMDAVYGHHSHFLESAEKEGHTVISGEWMLLHQAVKAFEHVYKEEMQRHHLSTQDVEAPMRYALKNFSFDEQNSSIKRKIEAARKEIN